jgi:mannose-6-phosphate isomerase-like protein (cupin superfamily)
MIVLKITEQEPFATKDGSMIRSILDASNAPVQHQSLAEASLEEVGAATEAHYHLLSEEFYYIFEGEGEMTLDGETRAVQPGDAILIPPGAWHSITAKAAPLRFLCCCAPPYSHQDTYFE